MDRAADSRGERLSRRRLVQSLFGAAAVAAAGRADAQEQTATGSGTRHTVEMTDELVFDPDDLTIAPGDVIVWENVGQVGHSVTAYEDGIPEEAAYFAAGGFDSEDAARSAYTPGDPSAGDVGEGETFERQFQEEGTYDYFCIPHETVGMVASFEVTTATPSEGGGAPSLPESAIRVGLLAAFALVAVVGMAYVLLKYGGDYEPGE